MATLLARPRRYSDGADGASLPLREEGPEGISPAQYLEGVDLHGAQPKSVHRK